jgi:hypothetical protein
MIKYIFMLYVSVSTDDERIGLSLHVHDADEEKLRSSVGSRMNYKFVVIRCNL